MKYDFSSKNSIAQYRMLHNNNFFMILTAEYFSSAWGASDEGQFHHRISRHVGSIKYNVYYNETNINDYIYTRSPN